MPEPSAARLAVLIDADNCSPSIASDLFKEIAKLGDASIRRIYGDFSGTKNGGWRKILNEHAIIPHMNVEATKGKNASDIVLVIDAMDLMHSGRVEGFCIVSSDADFTRLASRLREQGLDVYGFGERKTPEAFRNACRRFIYTENLAVGEETVAEAKAGVASGPRKTEPPSKAAALIRRALNNLESEDGWFYLGPVGEQLINMHPDFDTRTYGCAKLSTLVEKAGGFDIERHNQQVRLRRRD